MNLKENSNAEQESLKTETIDNSDKKNEDQANKMIMKKYSETMNTL